MHSVTPKSTLLSGLVLHSAALAAAASSSASVTATRSISIPLTAPTNASSVPADFVSFGFDTAVVGNTSDIKHTNLIQAVSSRVSAPNGIVLRSGGTSGDYITVNPDQTEPIVCLEPDGECDGAAADSQSLGPSYFQGFKSQPGCRRTFMVPLGGTVNGTNVRRFVRRAWDAITSVGSGASRVAAIEIGNEPSVYTKNVTTYIEHVKQIMDIIIDELGLSGDNATIFELGDIISAAAQYGNPYDVKSIFQNGINSDGYAAVAGEHYYQATKNYTFPETLPNLQRYLMNHTFVTEHLDGNQRSIDYMKENFPKVPYVLSETGSAINNVTATFASGFGATLWHVDFDLSAMARGVARVVHALPPGVAIVRPRFVAAPFVADFIGNASSPGNVGEIAVPNNQDVYSAYALWKDGSVQRVALLNMKMWNRSSGKARQSMAFSVDLGKNVASVEVRRLSCEAGAEGQGLDLGGPMQNVTWAGEQWSGNVKNAKSFFPNGREVVEKINVQDGRVSVDVRDSEVAVLRVVS